MVKIYSPEKAYEIQEAIVFMVEKFKKSCRNTKPVILHSVRAGCKLMQIGETPEVVKAGILHDLVEDSDCKIKEIRDKFGLKVGRLVSANTMKHSIKSYKKRWQKEIKKLIKNGREAMIIKAVDCADNLPYFVLVSNGNLKKRLIWKHNLVVTSFSKYFAKEKFFQNYAKDLKDLSA